VRLQPADPKHCLDSVFTVNSKSRGRGCATAVVSGGSVGMGVAAVLTAGRPVVAVLARFGLLPELPMATPKNRPTSSSTV
jgi:hypothetical protein